MKQATMRKRRGFLLLEMILALAVFSMAATGFVVALQRMSKVAALAHDELRVTRILDSAMNEVQGWMPIEVGEKALPVDAAGVEVLCRIDRIEDLQNRDGSTLDEIYRIRLTARWYQDGQWRTRESETWRNGRMYQP